MKEDIKRSCQMLQRVNYTWAEVCRRRNNLHAFNYAANKANAYSFLLETIDQWPEEDKDALDRQFREAVGEIEGWKRRSA